MKNKEVKEKRHSNIIDKNAELRETKLKELCEGYILYGDMNTEYAEMCLEADNQVMAFCEEKLSESE